METIQVENKDESQDIPAVELRFKFEIDEVVLNTPTATSLHRNNVNDLVQYKVLSRIYEEISSSGGIISYAVRHIDPNTPGGGKVFKFQESELVSLASYKTLLELTKNKNKSEDPNEDIWTSLNTKYGSIKGAVSSGTMPYTISTTTTGTSSTWP